MVALAVLLLALPERCAGQDSYIEGISAIAASPDGSEVDTWSETYVTPDLAYYYGAYVEGYLYQNGGPIDDGDAAEYPYFNDAIWEMSDPVEVGSDYQLVSNHGVLAYWIYDDDGTDYYYNPDGFESSGDVPSGTDFDPGDGAIYVEVELIYVGSTAADMSAAPPSITGLNPSTAAVGSSGAITVTGANLLDPCTGNTTANITGSGISLSVSSVSTDGTQALLNYSIATNASTGNQALTLTTCFGTSNQELFQVGDPTPVIQSVNPSSWLAGQQISFTVNGTGFGTAPTLQVAGNGVSCCTNVAGSDTQISATASVAANAPNGLATITVTSTGYYGSGFMPIGGGGSTSSTTTTANIVATQGPAPTILWGVDPGGNGSICNSGAQNIAGTTAENPFPVVVGQQIAFTACFPVPPGATISSESWSPTRPKGTVVAGYNASTSGGSVQEFEGATCSTVNSYCDFTPFYWVDVGGNGSSFTFSYLLSNETTGSATVTFGVTGLPAVTTASLTSSVNGVNIWPPGAIWPDVQLPIVELGNGSTTAGAGVTFTVTQPPGQGAYSWVQLITSDVQQFVTNQRVITCEPPAVLGKDGPPTTPDPNPELDSGYPYPGGTGNSMTDSPYMAVDMFSTSPTGEGSRKFSAMTYLMWTPNAASGCSGAACTIPVPVGTLSWSYCSDAINTLVTQNNGTTYSLACSSVPSTPIPFRTSIPATDPSSSFPVWQHTGDGHVWCPIK
jgi:hypothetical protein